MNINEKHIDARMLKSKMVKPCFKRRKNNTAIQLDTVLARESMNCQFCNFLVGLFGLVVKTTRQVTVTMRLTRAKERARNWKMRGRILKTSDILLHLS